MGYTQQTSATDRAPAQADPQLPGQGAKLAEYGEIATARLAAGLADALNQVVELLFAKGIQGTNTPEQQIWLAAADFARLRRNDIADAFATHFDKHYTDYCQQKLEAPAGKTSRPSAGDLHLVEREVLEYVVTPEVMVEAVRNATWVTLPELARWFKDMLAAPDLSPLDLPLGPQAFGTTVSRAINEQFGKPEVKQRVFKALCKPLPDLVNRVYQDLNQHVTGQAPAPQTPRATPGTGPAAAPAVRAPALVPIRAASLTAAHAALDERLARIRLPEFIAEFLYGPWQRLLGTIHQEAGVDSPEWKHAFHTMEELLHSLSTRQSADACLRLTRDLPDLARRLVSGLERIGETAAMHERFFKRLADYHIRLLARLGASNTATPAAGNPEPASPAKPRPTLDERRIDALIAAIEIGTPLELRDGNLPARKLKFAWISPNRSLFILVNHMGERALSVGPRDLADMLRNGTAHLPSGTAAPASGGGSSPVLQAKKTA